MSARRINWYKYAAPASFYALAGKMIPWFAVFAALLFVVGLYVGFFVAPTDFQQGEAYRIIFIHVPAAWMGMFLYVLMAIYAGIGWAFNARLASMMATAISTTGAIFTFISLVTGSLWGRPAWGVYWVWDARMTSTLILMFIYFSVQWWNSLHQGATIRIASKPTMAPTMLAAMLVLLGACWVYSIAVVLVRVRCIIREREREAPWLAEAIV